MNTNKNWIIMIINEIDDILRLIIAMAMHQNQLAIIVLKFKYEL